MINRIFSKLSKEDNKELELKKVFVELGYSVDELVKLVNEDYDNVVGNKNAANKLAQQLRSLLVEEILGSGDMLKMYEDQIRIKIKDLTALKKPMEANGMNTSVLESHLKKLEKSLTMIKQGVKVANEIENDILNKIKV